MGNFGYTSAASAVGTGTFTIGPVPGQTPAAPFSLGNGTSAAGRLSTNNAEVWNSDFTVVNTYMNMGTGAVSLGTSAGATRTITTTNGVIPDR